MQSRPSHQARAPPAPATQVAAVPTASSPTQSPASPLVGAGGRGCTGATWVPAKETAPRERRKCSTAVRSLVARDRRGDNPRADHGRARHDDRQCGARHAVARSALVADQHRVGLDWLSAVARCGDPLPGWLTEGFGSKRTEIAWIGSSRRGRVCARSRRAIGSRDGGRAHAEAGTN